MQMLAGCGDGAAGNARGSGQGDRDRELGILNASMPIKTRDSAALKTACDFRNGGKRQRG
jgi:hypothetical protein